MTTLAIDRYDRLLPFYDGTVQLPPGLNLEVLQVGQEGPLRNGRERHERMLRHAEFDAAEVSLSSYIAACARGLPFTAIPVFPRRLFSLGQVFVNTAAGIRHPRDLAGRNVGLQSFQTTLAVLAKGDMSSEYGLDLKAVRWHLRDAETVDVSYAAGYDINRLGPGQDLIGSLMSGRLDAIFYSRTPWKTYDPALPIRRLFDDPEAEEARYFKKNGYWPIMHVVAIRSAALAVQPELPRQLLAAFESAAAIARGYLDDPNWSRLAWSKYTRDREVVALAPDPWVSGVAANMANLERFIGYSLEQGLIDRRLAVEALFHPSVRDT